MKVIDVINWLQTAGAEIMLCKLARQSTQRATLDKPPDPAFLKVRSMDFHMDKIVEQRRQVLEA